LEPLHGEGLQTHPTFCAQEGRRIVPYIEPEDRQRFEFVEHELSTVDIQGPGELNYLFTLVIKRYIEQKGVKYLFINDVMGALTGALQEFYRRVAAPYEDQKIIDNGDVY
jgi:hypothetical protein